MTPEDLSSTVMLYLVEGKLLLPKNGVCFIWVSQAFLLKCDDVDVRCMKLKNKHLQIILQSRERTFYLNCKENIKEQIKIYFVLQRL